MQGPCEGGRIEASCFGKRCFFSSGKQEDGEIPVTLLQSFSPSTLLLKSMSGQSSLCLPFGTLQAGTKRAAGSAGHPSWSLDLLPLAEGCVKKTRRIQLAWAAGSLRMIFTPVPLASQMTACCHPSWLWGFFGWGFTSPQQFEHQPRLEEVEDMYPPTSPQVTPPL